VDTRRCHKTGLCDAGLRHFMLKSQPVGPKSGIGAAAAGGNQLSLSAKGN
jgi:hypothetical protein